VASGRGVDRFAAFNTAEPWVDEQIMRRFAGIAHVFPAYSLPVIEQLPYAHWVNLAAVYDDHVAEMDRQAAQMKRR